MSRTYKGKDRHIRIRSQRRNPPDIRKLGAAIIALAQAQAEKAAELEHKRAAAKTKQRQPRASRTKRAADA